MVVWCCEVTATYREAPAGVPMPAPGLSISVGRSRTDVSIQHLRIRAITPEAAHGMAVETLLGRVEARGFLERPRRPVVLSCEVSRSDVSWTVPPAASAVVPLGRVS